MIKEKRLYGIFYMFFVTAFFSSIVIGFAKFTDEKVRANKQLAFEKAVLSVLPNLLAPDATNLELHQKFVEKVNLPDSHSGNACTLKEDGKLVAYALPIEGQGFWSPIKGIIGIESDKKTIIGIAFYEQNETPGLGAQILTSGFRNQFKGKIISATDKPMRIKPTGSALGINGVHAVTGATQTSARLEKIINDTLTKWQIEMGIRK